MSIPANPLDESGSSSFRHVLIAFKYSADAFNIGEFNPDDATIGESLPNAGPNIVVVNEFLSQRFSIAEAVWDFNFIPNIGVSTTASVGKIVIEDRYVPYSFVDYLSQEVLASFNQDSGTLMSLGHATFVLKTFFTSNDSAGGEDTDIIQVNPYFFNIDSVESVALGASIAPNAHILNALGAANTTGLLRSFSSVFQMNITHKDGNIHDTIPQGTGSGGGLRTRSAEDGSNIAKRKERLDLSKPMLTLKDMFEGLEADLNQQKYVHQAQLQEWRRQIRSDGQPDKIVVAPQQKKPPKPQELPIDYVIDLDTVYDTYDVDNRNMPFEQPEIAQDQVGLRVFPVRPGANIFELVERIMLLSKRVGEDAVDPNGRKTFKTTITTNRLNTDRYEVNIKIRQYDLPSNGVTNNTGPGTNGEENSLEFFVNDPDERDTDVLEFKNVINYEVGDNMLEVQNDEDIGAGVVYADREQATAERRADLPFFQTLYSGIRPMIASYGIDGLESAQRAGNVFNLMDRYTYTQTTDYEMVIIGNPHLMSDVNRNPRDVIADSAGGGTFYYELPENDPMYVKLTIFLRSYDSGPVDDTGGNQQVPTQFYFDDWYHMTRVVNMFGTLDGHRSFNQKLFLKRSDTLI